MRIVLEGIALNIKNSHLSSIYITTSCLDSCSYVQYLRITLLWRTFKMANTIWLTTTAIYEPNLNNESTTRFISNSRWLITKRRSKSEKLKWCIQKGERILLICINYIFQSLLTLTVFFSTITSTPSWEFFNTMTSQRFPLPHNLHLNYENYRPTIREMHKLKLTGTLKHRWEVIEHNNRV